jgi:hypothetical protein
MNYPNEWNELVAPENHTFDCNTYETGRRGIQITHIVVHI